MGEVGRGWERLEEVEGRGWEKLGEIGKGPDRLVRMGDIEGG